MFLLLFITVMLLGPLFCSNLSDTFHKNLMREKLNASINSLNVLKDGPVALKRESGHNYTILVLLYYSNDARSWNYFNFSLTGINVKTRKRQLRTNLILLTHNLGKVMPDAIHKLTFNSKNYLYAWNVSFMLPALFKDAGALEAVYIFDDNVDMYYLPNRWYDADNQTVHVLPPPVQKVSRTAEGVIGKSIYRIWIHFADDMNSGTNADIYMDVCGTKGGCHNFHMKNDEGADDVDYFEQNELNGYLVQWEFLGELTYIKMKRTVGYGSGEAVIDLVAINDDRMQIYYETSKSLYLGDANTYTPHFSLTPEKVYDRFELKFPFCNIKRCSSRWSCGNFENLHKSGPHYGCV